MMQKLCCSAPKDNKEEVKHKVKPFTYKRAKKVACCLSKVKSSTKNQHQKKLILWLWKSKIVLNFEPLSIGGSIVATLSQQDLGGAFSLVYAFGTILDPVADPESRFD